MRLIALACIVSLAYPSAIFANPTGEQVIAGAASFQRNGTTLTVNQSTHNAIIHWQDFSINANELTQFNQPSSLAAALNRVVGGNPSQLLGALSANGQIYLINPNGILIGSGAQINCASFIASTLNVSNEEFLARGAMNFYGNSTAGIQNLGTVNAIGGDIFLIANKIENKGILSAPSGKVGLAAGNDVLLKQDGSSESFLVRSGIKTGDETTGVNNTGVVQATAAEIKAAKGNIYALAINNEGTVRATGAVNRNGRIILTAGGGTIQNKGLLEAKNADGSGGSITMQNESNIAKNSTVINTGTVDASGVVGSGTKGGSVQILGDKVALLDDSKVDVSGDTGGGTALVGGDYQGKNAGVQNSLYTFVGDTAQILADARVAGDGGKVIVWADEVTRFYGEISAKGGAVSGNGGFAEVSGKNHLDFQGGADLRAPNGTSGTLLLDPADITITDNANSNSQISWNATLFEPDASISVSILDIAQLNTQLGLGAVTITTTNSGSPGAGTGNITLNASYTITGNNSLTMDAYNNIILNGNISLGGGSANLSLNAGVNGGTVGTITGNGNLSSNNIVLNGKGLISLSGTISATGTFFASANAGDIVLNNASNSFGGGVALCNTGANDVSIRASGGINFANLGSVTDVGRYLTINAGGAVTQSAQIIVAGGLELLGTGSYNLNDTGNNIGLIAGNVGGFVTVTSNKTGSVSIGTVNTVGLTTGGNLNIEACNAAGSISVDQDITLTKVAAGTATLKAANNVVFSSGAGMTATAAAMGITIHSDGDNNAAGSIELNAGASINSNGGQIILGGGSNPTSDYAMGTAAYNHGIFMDGATVSAGGGNIQLRGQAWDTAGASGVMIVGGTALSTTGSGQIMFDGIASGAQPGLTGVRIGGASTVTAENGNPLAISITGTSTSSGGNSYGVELAGGSSLNTSSGTGNIVIQGIYAGGNAGFVTSSGPNSITAGSGNITINANAMDFDDTTLTGTGILTLAPTTASTNIGIGTAAGTLLINATELGKISDGFSSVVIGHSAGTGTITIQTVSTLTDPYTFRSASGGTIDFEGSLTGSGDAAFTFNAPTISIGNNVTTASGDINFSGAVTMTGGMAITSTSGNITFSSTLDGGNPLVVNTGGDLAMLGVVGGTTALSGINITAANISLSGNASTTGHHGYTGNVSFGGSLTSSGGHITVNDSDGFTFSSISAGSYVGFNSASGSVTQSAGLIATGGLQLLGGATYTLNNAANSFATLAALTTGGNLDLRTSSALTIDTVNGTSGISADGNVYIYASNGDLTVSQNITKTGSSNASLNLLSNLGVVFNNSADVGISTSGTYAVTLNSDRDGNFIGNIHLGSGTTIDSNGGNIILGGGANPITTAAYGTGGQPIGVLMDGATLTATTGNIQIRGTGAGGTTNAYGVKIFNGSVVQTTSGTIAVNGTGGTGTDYNNGLLLSGIGSKITSDSGNISITTTGAGSGIANFGLEISTSSYGIESTGVADIFITAVGAAGSSGISMSTGQIGGGSMTGNLVIETNDVSASGGNILGTGNLAIRQNTVGGTMGIGTGSAGTLNLDNTEVGLIANGFTSISFGRADGTGTVTVTPSAPLTFYDPVTFRSMSAGGTVAVGGTLFGSDDASFTFSAFNLLSLNGSVSTGTGDITFNNPVTITGASAVNSTSGHIAFQSTINGAFGLTLNSGTGTTSVVGVVGGITALANLFMTGSALGLQGAVSTTGSQTYTGPMNLGGNLTSTAGSITLNGITTLKTGVIMTGTTGITLNNDVISDGTARNLNLNSNGNITVNNHLGTNNAGESLGALSFGGTAGIINVVGNIDAASITLTSSTSTTFDGYINLSGNFSAPAAAGDLNMNASSTIGGAVTFSTNGGIQLGNDAGDTFNFGGISHSGSGALHTYGTIYSTGGVNLGSLVTLDGDTHINVTGPNNLNTGASVTGANNSLYLNTGAGTGVVVLGAITNVNSLFVTTNQASNLTQAGAITANSGVDIQLIGTGGAMLNNGSNHAGYWYANASGGNITINDNAATTYSVQTAGNVNLSTGTDMTLQGIASNVLTLNAGGRIDQSGGVQAVTLNAASSTDAIYLDSYPNFFNNINNVSANSDIVIRDSLNGMDVVGTVSSSTGSIGLIAHGGNLTIQNGAQILATDINGDIAFGTNNTFYNYTTAANIQAGNQWVIFVPDAVNIGNLNGLTPTWTKEIEIDASVLDHQSPMIYANPGNGIVYMKVINLPPPPSNDPNAGYYYLPPPPIIDQLANQTNMGMNDLQQFSGLYNPMDGGMSGLGSMDGGLAPIGAPMPGMPSGDMGFAPNYGPMPSGDAPTGSLPGGGTGVPAPIPGGDAANAPLPTGEPPANTPPTGEGNQPPTGDNTAGNDKPSGDKPAGEGDANKGHGNDDGKKDGDNPGKSKDGDKKDGDKKSDDKKGDDKKSDDKKSDDKKGDDKKSDDKKDDGKKGDKKDDKKSDTGSSDSNKGQQNKEPEKTAGPGDMFRMNASGLSTQVPPNVAPLLQRALSGQTQNQLQNAINSGH